MISTGTNSDPHRHQRQALRAVASFEFSKGVFVLMIGISALLLMRQDVWVIAESLLMACAQVIGYDAAITWCCAAGNFELNVMMPVMAYDLLESIALLAAVSRNFSRRAIAGLQADRERASAFVEQSLAMCTVLAPVIGYEKAAAIAKEAYRSGRTVREVARELSGIPEDRLNQLLDPRSQTGAGSASSTAR